MRLLGAGVRLPAVNENRWPEGHRPPLAFPRPEFRSDQMAFEFALPAARDALQTSRTRPGQIDMVIALSASLDHIVDVPELCAPSIAHPVQRALGLTNAYLLYLLDGDWCFAAEVARGYCRELGLSRVLLLFANSTAPAYLPDPQSGFALHDGAAALVLSKEGDADEGLPPIEYLDIAGFPLPACRITPRHEIDPSGPRGSISYPSGPEFLTALNAGARELVGKALAAGAARVVAESWFPGHLAEERSTWPSPALPDGASDHPGPFALPLASRTLLESGARGHAAVLTFNAIQLRYGCLPLWI